MSWLKGLRTRVDDLLRRSTANRRTDDEIRFHLDMQTEKNLGRGMTPAEARRRAAVAFGGVERHREAMRDGRGLGRIEEVVADSRYAVRALARNPGFTVVALLTLALGIGANSAMFGVVNGILLRPLPYPDADELVLLYQSSPRRGEQFGRVSFEDLQDWRARMQSLSLIGGFASVPTILTGTGEPVELEMTYVTEAFFNVLGVSVEYGRPLVPDDFRLRQRSAVISERMWRAQLGADPGIVGRSLLLRGEPYTVVGVLPASVRYPTPETAVWVPQSLVEPNMFSNGVPTRKDRYLQVVARLAPGADAARVHGELTALSGQLAAAYPASNADWSAAAVVALHTSIVGDVDRALVVVLGVVGFILLIGCANLANLLLARGSARRREIAIRSALGAGRRRIVRQLLTESLVLAVLGGALGILLSYWGVRTILGLSADTLPRVENVRVDAGVVAFGLCLAVLTGILFGLAPALRMARTDPQADLRGGRGTVGSEGRRLRSALVVAEVALAVLLVIGAGLMARSFLALRSVDAGFNPERVLTVSIQFNLAGVPDDELGSFLVGRRERILESVRALPGVEEAGMISVLPLRDDFAYSLEYTRANAPPGETGVQADTRYVDPGYLRTMGIPLLRGAHLPAQLAAGAPVPVLMSESAARRLWPNEDPLGRFIDVPWGESVVIGIVGDVRQIALAEAPPPAVYFPQLIAPRLLATLAVRTASDPMDMAGPIRGVIREIDPNQPIRSIAPLRTVMAESIARDRFFTVLFGVFGGVALALAAIGIYGVLAYSVRQRTQEFGVRMALGARAADVRRMVIGAGMRLVGAGVLLGAIAAAALSRILASQLYGITATDPATFAAAIAFLGVVALLSTSIPAWRATRVQPMTALRPD